MDVNTNVQSTKKFRIDSLDDTDEEEVLDRAFGDDLSALANHITIRRDDQPPTTQKEIWGWYLYEGANQPYSR